jgi:hypothetical protein
MTVSSILLYVDPGSGSYLVQVVIAAILGVLFYFKIAWWKIRSLFTRKKKDGHSKNDSLNA